VEGRASRSIMVREKRGKMRMEEEVEFVQRKKEEAEMWKEAEAA